MDDPGREPGPPSRPHALIDLVALALVVLFAGLHLYRGLTVGSVAGPTSVRNYAIAATVLVGVAIYFTPYWQPVLYLVAAVFVGTLTVFWTLQDPVTVALEVSRVVLGVSLLLAFVYLFDRERARRVRDED